MSSAKRINDILKENETQIYTNEPDVKFRNEYDTLKERLDKIKGHFQN
jgi:soluble cytochrome b562